jgi:coronin-1B/1C/6
MSKFVRSSKYRHVFGTQVKREECYDQVKVTRSAWDSPKIAASTQQFSVIWDAAGGGAFVPINYSDSGKRTPNPPLVAGHKGEVLDIDYHPFNPFIVASGSEDCTCKIWQIPKEGLKETITEPVQDLRGHKRKVGTTNFNPVANNVLATSGTDYLINIWDIEKGSVIQGIGGHSNIIQSVCWNQNGSLLTTASKDKKMRLIDPRANSVVRETEAHEGVKGFRSIFLDGQNKIFTIGFNKSAHRQYKLWEVDNFDKALTSKNVDTSAGQILPYYDVDTAVLFLAGKGDGNIRYYEVTNSDEFIYYLSEYKSAEPLVGMCTVPKRGLDILGCEIVRMLKIGKSQIQPIAFRVPRKSDLFQDDIFPDTYAGIPSLSAEQWKAGENADPVLVNLEPKDNAEKKKEAEATITFQKAEPVKELSEKEIREEHENKVKKIAYLEAELVKRDAKIEELQKKVDELSGANN